MIETIFNQPSLLISYSHADKRKIMQLKKKLDALGINYFLDEKDIKPSEDIVERVRNGIEDCTHFLVYLSPASIKSQWVLIEIGMAWGLHRAVIPYLDHPSLERPDVIRSLKYVTSLSELTAYLEDLKKTSHGTLIAQMSALERAAKDTLYYFPGGFARAIRLFGADDEYVTEDRVEVHYVHDPLVIPFDLAENKRKVIKEKEEDARRRNAPFFNGPNTRLIRWKATPKGGAHAVLEQKTLELELGPVNWFDYEGLNEAFRELIPNFQDERGYEPYLGLSRLIKTQDVTASRLSNILDTGATIVSRDGYVAYQERGQRVSAVPGKLTSAVAENINRYLDDAEPKNSRTLLNPINGLEAEQGRLDENYQPKCVPHPFAAVRRGIVEELSPNLLHHIGPMAIKLIGLSYDLEAFHPDALFAIFVDLNRNEILELCKANPGKDWTEGKLHFTKAIFGDMQTAQLLKEQRWVPGGAASLVCTLTLLQAMQRHLEKGFTETFEFLFRAA